MAAIIIVSASGLWRVDGLNDLILHGHAMFFLSSEPACQHITILYLTRQLQLSFLSNQNLCLVVLHMCGCHWILPVDMAIHRGTQKGLLGSQNIPSTKWHKLAYIDLLIRVLHPSQHWKPLYYHFFPVAWKSKISSWQKGVSFSNSMKPSMLLVELFFPWPPWY